MGERHGRWLRAGAATFSALALLASAGCGGNSRLSKAAYEQKLQKDGKQVSDTFSKLNGSVNSLPALAAQIGKGQNELRKVADDLGGIKPPKAIERDNATLVRGLRALASELESLKTGAAKGDAKLVQKASLHLQRSSALRAAQAATKDMKAKGYKISAIAG